MNRRNRMSEGKKSIISNLLQEYDIKNINEIHEALKDLLGETVKDMLESEMDDQLGDEHYEILLQMLEMNINLRR